MPTLYKQRPYVFVRRRYAAPNVQIPDPPPPLGDYIVTNNGDNLVTNNGDRLVWGA